MVNDRILLAREERYNRVVALAKHSDVVTLKANLPGVFKNAMPAELLVKFFVKEIVGIGGKFLGYLEGADGVTAIFFTENGVAFKKKAIELEENHPLGRLVDIDVTLKGETQSLSRGKRRKCFLCEKDAFVCIREENHKTADLVRFFFESTIGYIVPILNKIVLVSMLEELNLENKFGLVTPTSSGSHTDLNYDIMRKAIDAVVPLIARAFTLGFTYEGVKLLGKLIILGQDCESEMLKVTNGANAYKGFIFVGGLLLASAGYTLNKGGSEDDIYKNAKKIIDDYIFPTDTFGSLAHSHGFGGVRKEATSGFPTVEKAEKLLGKSSLHSILTFIVDNLDDSVLLKRSGSVKRYKYYKKLIVSSSGKEKEVTKECVENNISIGGSADVLIASIMMKKIKENFFFKV